MTVYPRSTSCGPMALPLVASCMAGDSTKGPCEAKSSTNELLHRVFALCGPYSGTWTLSRDSRESYDMSSDINVIMKKNSGPRGRWRFLTAKHVDSSRVEPPTSVSISVRALPD
ncbi:hypothetical protein HGRIS_008469 [Hohenbuehelia grisea]|uniref:Secreted protein n=1 Tax=Hohenbuehelia grisea TaxID=104357 RepID=A0ABR3J878_9AGAR